jgi:serine/threonine-protein kinase
MLLLDASAGHSSSPRTPCSVSPTSISGLDCMPVAVGEILGGKYRVERILGYGGMGVVVAAKHMALERMVALKIMRPELCDDEAANTRFLREARAAARLSGNHVARVIDVGTIAASDGLQSTEVPCIVMEYLDGQDLGAYLARRGAMPVDQVVDLMLQACEALDEAHAASIIHRDLKPANLFLATRSDGSRVLKVLDFGISKDNRAELRVTKASDTIGSPLYVAPEQLISAHDVDVRADVWALGVIMYELTAGTSPFHGRNATAICASVLQARYRPLGEVCSMLPAGFDQVVARCLQRDPDHRFASVAELAAALAPYAANRFKTSRWWTRVSAPAASQPSMVPAAAPSSHPSLGAVPAAAPSSLRGIPAAPHSVPAAASHRGLQPPATPAPAAAERKPSWGVWFACAALLGVAVALPLSERLVGWQMGQPSSARAQLVRAATPLIEDTFSLLVPELVAQSALDAAPSPRRADPPPMPAASVVTLDELPDLTEPPPQEPPRAARPAPRRGAPTRASSNRRLDGKL